MKISKEAIGRAIGKSVDAAFVFGGTGLAGYGAWMVYEPAAFILVGGVLFWLGLPD